METQFQYIVSLAKQYHEYSEHNGDLFAAINALHESVVNEIYSEYGDPERDFKPVNLLRAEIARRLSLGESITENLINDIKDNIRNQLLKVEDKCKTTLK